MKTVFSPLELMNSEEDLIVPRFKDNIKEHKKEDNDSPIEEVIVDNFEKCENFGFALLIVSLTIVSDESFLTESARKNDEFSNFCFVEKNVVDFEID